MKKITLFVFLIILFIFPIVSNADMDMGWITPYDVRVSNINGVKLIQSDESEITAPYDTVLTISLEFYENGELYGYGSTSYDDKGYYVKLSDVELLSNEIDLSKFEKSNKKMYVIDKGAYLYKGPSKIYGKVDGNIEIPVGTTVTIEYSDEMWGYLEYNGVKGWVYIYSIKWNTPYNEDSALASIPNEGINTDIYTLEDIQLEASPRNQENGGYSLESREKIDIIVPAFTELNYKYEYLSHHGSKYVCVEYDGKEGWIFTPYIFSTAYSCKNRDVFVYITEDSSLYANFRDSSKVLTVIPKNTECNIIYYCSDNLGVEQWCYVSYNGQEGWIVYKDWENDPYYNEDLSRPYDGSFATTGSYHYDTQDVTDYKTQEDLYIYNEIDGDIIDKIIPAGTILTEKYHYYNRDSEKSWYYLYNDEYQGWINVNLVDLKKQKCYIVNLAGEIVKVEYEADLVENNNKEAEKNDDMKIQNAKNATSRLINKEIEKNNDTKTQNAKKKIMIMFIKIIKGCMIIAVAISIIAIVLIKKVNKKKED